MPPIFEDFHPKSYTDQLLEQVLLNTVNGANVYNNTQIHELTGSNTSLSLGTHHKVMIFVIDGSALITIGSTSANVLRGFNCTLEATTLLADSIQIDTDPTVGATVIVITHS